jgi:uncharacterized protein
MAWRQWNNALHRDLGYLCAGLTLVYVVSGIAVNHVGDWNPNYRIERSVRQITPVGPLTAGDRTAIEAVLASLGLPPRYRTIFRTDSTKVRIFLEDGIVDIETATGQASIELVHNRVVLQAANALHLNTPKRLWTWVADLYAASLGLLAITGLFVLKGKKGITGRGAWLTALGVALPLLFLWLYR